MTRIPISGALLSAPALAISLACAHAGIADGVHKSVIKYCFVGNAMTAKPVDVKFIQDNLKIYENYGHIKYEGREYHVGSAFAGLHLALRPTITDGLFDVFFCNHKIGKLDLRDNKLS